ncbi:MAG: surface lipoprotein assembly modifier [Hyphomonadaceae bacterium]|nr:surface lipoprotein assembly modifier [Hyphomonadaceae bacterium]
MADLDTNTGEGDWAATINLLAEATLTPVDKLTLRGGYDFSQSLHQEFDAFDLAIHRGYAEIAYDFDVATAGVLGNLAQANLDGDEYLTYTQVSPYLSKQFGNTLFLRGAYAATEKEFNGRPERDANSDALQLDAYFFLDGVKRYIVLGGKATEEDANADEFDYKSGTFKARFVQRFDAMDREMTFRLGAEYEDRDYDNPHPDILPLPATTSRSDKRTVIDTQLDIPLGERFFSEISYRYGNYSSNLLSADYNEHVGAIKIGVRY